MHMSGKRHAALELRQDAGYDDDVTRRDNSSPGSVLQFDVSGTTTGATVTVYAGGTQIGSAVAAGSSTRQTPRVTRFVIRCPIWTRF